MPSQPEDREAPASRDPGQPFPPPASAPPPAGSPEDAVRRLEQRLSRATEAAERLMAQATPEASGARGAGGGAGDPLGGAGDAGARAGHPDNPTDGAKPPPAGWQVPEDVYSGTSPELDPFIGLLQAVRELIPPELQRRLVAALRELLLALRALIDWYLERLERQREQSVEVEEIPIL